MQTRSISEILESLQKLRLIEQELQKELQDSVNNECERIIKSDRRVLSPEQARQIVFKRASTSAANDWSVVRVLSFQIGDRVYIDNAITSASEIANTGDRKATIRGISGPRYLITTDNGLKTHRLGKHLLKLIEKRE